MGEPEPTDEELMRRLASGREDAIRPLHVRYARLIFQIAARSLGQASAEEIVQEVFVTIWRKAGTFDPSKGSFRSWSLRIAHRRVINELRRRSRRPKIEADEEGSQLGSLPESGPSPDEAAWLDHQRAIIRSAVEKLPPTQRQALSLAFLEDLTHQQVAESLNLPLGTAKSRIRAGLQTLRGHLAPAVMAGVVLVALVTWAILRDRAMQAALDRECAALALVTSSDVSPLRLVSPPGSPGEIHANYRGRPGSSTAVMTFSKFPPPAARQAYRAWGYFDGRWYLLGNIKPDVNGSDLLIIEGGHLAKTPTALSVTLGPVDEASAPDGRSVVSWPGP